MGKSSNKKSYFDIAIEDYNKEQEKLVKFLIDKGINDNIELSNIGAFYSSFKNFLDNKKNDNNFINDFNGASATERDNLKQQLLYEHKQSLKQNGKQKLVEKVEYVKKIYLDDKRDKIIKAVNDKIQQDDKNLKRSINDKTKLSTTLTPTLSLNEEQKEIDTAINSNTGKLIQSHIISRKNILSTNNLNLPNNKVDIISFNVLINELVDILSDANKSETLKALNNPKISELEVSKIQNNIVLRNTKNLSTEQQQLLQTGYANQPSANNTVDSNPNSLNNFIQEKIQPQKQVLEQTKKIGLQSPLLNQNSTSENLNQNQEVTNMSKSVSTNFESTSKSSERKQSQMEQDYNEHFTKLMNNQTNEQVLAILDCNYVLEKYFKNSSNNEEIIKANLEYNQAEPVRKKELLDELINVQINKIQPNGKTAVSEDRIHHYQEAVRNYEEQQSMNVVNPTITPKIKGQLTSTENSSPSVAASSTIEPSSSERAFSTSTPTKSLTSVTSSQPSSSIRPTSTSLQGGPKSEDNSNSYKNSNLYKDGLKYLKAFERDEQRFPETNRSVKAANDAFNKHLSEMNPQQREEQINNYDVSQDKKPDLLLKFIDDSSNKISDEFAQKLFLLLEKPDISKIIRPSIAANPTITPTGNPVVLAASAANQDEVSKRPKTAMEIDFEMHNDNLLKNADPEKKRVIELYQKAINSHFDQRYKDNATQFETDDKTYTDAPSDKKVNIYNLTLINALDKYKPIISAPDRKLYRQVDKEYKDNIKLQTQNVKSVSSTPEEHTLSKSASEALNHIPENYPNLRKFVIEEDKKQAALLVFAKNNDGDKKIINQYHDDLNKGFKALDRDKMEENELILTNDPIGHSHVRNNILDLGAPTARSFRNYINIKMNYEEQQSVNVDNSTNTPQTLASSSIAPSSTDHGSSSIGFSTDTTLASASTMQKSTTGNPIVLAASAANQDEVSKRPKTAMEIDFEMHNDNLLKNADPEKKRVIELYQKAINSHFDQIHKDSATQFEVDNKTYTDAPSGEKVNIYNLTLTNAVDKYKPIISAPDRKLYRQADKEYKDNIKLQTQNAESVSRKSPASVASSQPSSSIPPASTSLQGGPKSEDNPNSYENSNLYKDGLKYLKALELDVQEFPETNKAVIAANDAFNKHLSEMNPQQRKEQMNNYDLSQDKKSDLLSKIIDDSVDKYITNDQHKGLFIGARHRYDILHPSQFETNIPRSQDVLRGPYNPYSTPSENVQPTNFIPVRKDNPYSQLPNNLSQSDSNHPSDPNLYTTTQFNSSSTTQKNKPTTDSSKVKPKRYNENTLYPDFMARHGELYKYCANEEEKEAIDRVKNNFDYYLQNLHDKETKKFDQLINKYEDNDDPKDKQSFLNFTKYNSGSYILNNKQFSDYNKVYVKYNAAQQSLDSSQISSTQSLHSPDQHKTNLHFDPERPKPTDTNSGSGNEGGSSSSEEKSTTTTRRIEELSEESGLFHSVSRFLRRFIGVSKNTQSKEEINSDDELISILKKPKENKLEDDVDKDNEVNDSNVGRKKKVRFEIDKERENDTEEVEAVITERRKKSSMRQEQKQKQDSEQRSEDNENSTERTATVPISLPTTSITEEFKQKQQNNPANEDHSDSFLHPPSYESTSEDGSRSQHSSYQTNYPSNDKKSINREITDEERDTVKDLLTISRHSTPSISRNATLALEQLGEHREDAMAAVIDAINIDDINKNKINPQHQYAPGSSKNIESTPITDKELESDLASKKKSPIRDAMSKKFSGASR